MSDWTPPSEPPPPPSMPSGPPERTPTSPPADSPPPFAAYTPQPPPPGSWQPLDGPPSPPSGPRRWLPWLAVVVALVVIVGIGVFVVTSDDDAPEGDVALDRDQEASPPTSAEDLDAVIEELIEFVEDERGLEFDQPPKITFQDDKEFEADLHALLEEDLAPEDLELEADYYRALGIIAPDDDLREIYQRLFGGAVLGYYEFETKELKVRGGEPTPYARETLAHELVHALEDQHFDIDREQFEDDPTERGLGLLGLTEGSAEYVAQAYERSLSDEERRELAREEMSFGADFDISGIPLFLLDNITVPYIAGPELVAAILADGGQEALDAAFEDPPVSSEQFLDPDTYLTRDDPIEVEPPAADGAEIERGAFGALFWKSLFFTKVPPNKADRAVEGWGGDEGVLYEDGERRCVRVNLVGDTEGDTKELYDALKARGKAGAEVMEVDLENDLVTFTSCG